MVDTNIGRIPIEDYLDIVAIENGFDNYEDLLNNGYDIPMSEKLKKEYEEYKKNN